MSLGMTVCKSCSGLTSCCISRIPDYAKDTCCFIIYYATSAVKHVCGQQQARVVPGATNSRKAIQRR